MRCDTLGAVRTEENAGWLMDLTACRNTLGEADIALVFWAQIIRHWTGGVRVISRDADLPMLHTFHFWADLLHKRVKISWDNDVDIRLPLSPFARALHAIGYARDTIVCMGILSKCDYFPKNIATKQVGHAELYHGIKAYMNSPRRRKDSLAQFHSFRDMLWHIYAQKLKCKPVPSEMKEARTRADMTLLITDDELMRPYVLFKLAYGYFTSFRCYRTNLLEDKRLSASHEDAELLVQSMQLD